MSRICAACQAENPGDASFCMKCGVSLEAACPNCGRPSPPMSIYCAGCGQKLPDETDIPGSPGLSPRSYTPRYLAEKIIRGRSAIEGERRTVTVLFADAMGFTPMSEQLGEEEIYRLMQGCLGCMMEAVHRYEGTVVQFTGDGVMAIFGAPIAHEDSARRAVAAALEMQRALGDYAEEVHKRHDVQCRFRVGLNTGVVVVGKISDDLGMDFTALGDTVNLAQRMESVAEPGSVYLTEHTFKAAGDFFECEPLGALTVKGKSAPVVAHKAVREKSVRSRLEAAAERGLTPFVGRLQELTVLRGYFDQARRGQGQVVFVTGEAGLGKSRLLLEFRRSLIDEPVRWLEGNCISYGKSIPYLPIADIVKRNFGVEETDSEARIIGRLEEGTASWSESNPETLPYLKYLLNVDPGIPEVLTMDPRERQAGVLDALRALVLEESARRPVLILLEDLHWIDEKSDEALRSLIDIVPNARVLMVINYRPGYVHALGDRTYFSRVALSVLQPEESATVAERVLQTASLPTQLAQLITRRGEGNPFYIEEVTKALVESGAVRQSNGTYVLARPVDQVEVPDTIQEVILSRIDRLEREARDAIQLASVIGREFTVKLLARISDVGAELEELLGGLKTLELIYEKAYFPELSYMFKHALTHDVAYSTLLAERRRALHRMVGLAIEELYADRLGENYEALAYHFYEGQDWEKALAYAEKAGDKTGSAFANQDALDYFARGIEVCGRVGASANATAVTLAEKRAWVNFTIGDLPACIADFNQMLETARELGDEGLCAAALCFRGFAELSNHEFERSEETIEKALSLTGAGNDELRLTCLALLATMLAVTNRWAEFNKLKVELDELAERAESPLGQVLWRMFDGMTQNWSGHFDEALRRVRIWRKHAEQIQQAGFLVWNGWCESLGLAASGRYSEALRTLDETLRLAERIGELAGRARALNTVGWVYCELQDHARGMEWNQRSLDLAPEIKALSKIEIEANARLNLADSLSQLGRLDEAEEHLKWVEAVVRNPRPEDRWMLWRYSQHMFHSYGELCLARGDAAQAMSYAGECLALAETSESRKNVVKARRLRGQAFMAMGKPGEADDEITAAVVLAREIGNPPQLWKTLVALGALRAAQGRDNEARALYREAIDVIDGVAGALEDEELRQTFEKSAHVQAIRGAGAAV